MGPAEDRRPPVVVLTVGDELLLGDRLDTNARWLARALTDASFRVVEVLTVGDDEGEIARAFAEAVAIARSGVVIVTGGLGPTSDDRTREAAAGFLGVHLVEEPELLSALEDRARQRGHAQLPRLHRRIARVPAGAVIHRNPVGLAPALELEINDGATTALFLLPGVPAEMQAVFTGSVQPALERRFPDRGGAAAVAVVRTSGIPESALAEALERTLPPELGVKLQYRPSVEGVELRFSATGDGSGLRLARALEAADPALAPWRLGGAGATLEGATLEACRRRGWTLGVAESCTGGMVGARLTDVPGSSDVFLGSVVAYSNRAKSTLLGVPPSLIEAEGAVSEPVARAMALGALGPLDANVSVAVTGIAGPGGGSPGRPVGTVWFAVAGGGIPVEAERATFPGGRDEIRTRATQHALRMIWRRARSGVEGVDSRVERPGDANLEA